MLKKLVSRIHVKHFIHIAETDFFSPPHKIYFQKQRKFTYFDNLLIPPLYECQNRYQREILCDNS
jgi:hypothetical protein